MPLLVYLNLKPHKASIQAIVNSDWDVLLSELSFLSPEELKHLHNAETWFYCPQAPMLDFHCRMWAFSEKLQML